MFKVKVYKVYPKNNTELYFLVDAPSKRIARWCGAALMNNDYACFLTAKDMVAEKFIY
jgi:hypothetical protein